VPHILNALALIVQLPILRIYPAFSSTAVVMLLLLTRLCNLSSVVCQCAVLFSMFWFACFNNRLRRKASFTANAGSRRRKPDNVEMQRLTEDQYDDDETVMFDRTDDGSRS